MFTIEVPDEVIQILDNYGHNNTALLHRIRMVYKQDTEIYNNLISYFTLDPYMYAPSDMPQILVNCLFDLGIVVNIQQRRNLLKSKYK